MSRTRVVVRPEVSVPAPAARALRDQSEVPIPAITYLLPSTTQGVTGVEIGPARLRPATVMMLTGPALTPRRVRNFSTTLTTGTYLGMRGSMAPIVAPDRVRASGRADLDSSGNPGLASCGNALGGQVIR